MTDDNPIRLSRRTVLAGIGAIGVASAGAGLGTTAYFSDQERFVENRLVAGSLDLKLDWSEHYFDASAGTEYGDYLGDGDLGDRYGFPSASPVFAVEPDDLDEFMDATAIEAYPDHDNDGIQSPPAGWDDPESDAYVCTLGADTPEDLDPREGGAGTGLRSENSDTWDSEVETYRPLVALDDVKPCDFGELTLSYHLCDNPGYIWLNGELIENAQNGYSEPELERLEELYGDDVPESGQLAESLFVRLWYDDGDNVFEDGETELLTGPLNAVMDLLGTGLGIPLDASGGVPIEPVGGDGATLTHDDCEVVAGNPTCGDQGLLRAIKVESEDLPTSVGDSETYQTAVGTVTITATEIDGGDVRAFDFELTGFEASAVIVKGGPNANVCMQIDDDEPVTASSGEGMRAPLRTGTTHYGVSHVSFCYAANPVTPDPEEPRACFEPSTTHYIGLEWWLPCEVGNEVQTDSIAFDLGFYTEQCRHNDGTGTVGNESNTDEAGPVA